MIGTNSTNEEGENYIRHLYNKLEEHKLFSKAEELYNTIITTTNHSNEDIEKWNQQLNKMDWQITNMMLHSEKVKCVRKNSAYWSPTIQQTNILVKYWQILNRSRKKKRNPFQRIKQIWNTMNTDSQQIIQTNKLSIKSALRKANKEHKQAIRNHRKHRATHMDRKVADTIERGTSKQKLTLKSLAARERKRNDFKIIKSVFKNTKGAGITTIEAPCPTHAGKWRNVTDPIEIIKLLLDRNISLFGQAHGTPFTIDPLFKIFQYSGATPEVISLIKDQIIPMEIMTQPKYIQDVIDKLSDGDNVTEKMEIISLEEFIAGMIKWKEQTTTSPSGRHLGHYKLLTRLQIFNEEKTINLSMRILNVYYQIAMSSAWIGKTLQRWSNISTCMIEKVKGQPRIDKPWGYTSV
jgi:hypothetical protein